MLEIKTRNHRKGQSRFERVQSKHLIRAKANDTYNNSHVDQGHSKATNGKMKMLLKNIEQILQNTPDFKSKFGARSYSKPNLHHNRNIFMNDFDRQKSLNSERDFEVQFNSNMPINNLSGNSHSAIQGSISPSMTRTNNRQCLVRMIFT